MKSEVKNVVQRCNFFEQSQNDMNKKVIFIRVMYFMYSLTFIYYYFLSIIKYRLMITKKN